MAYVYAHKRNDNNEIFYIGMSTSDDNSYRRSRLGSSQRSERWREIVNESGGFTITILHDNLSDDQASELEREEISKLGRKDLDENGKLTNLTSGGITGPKNLPLKPETIKKIIESDGYKNRVTSNKYKNKTYEEIYGEERAAEIKQKLKTAERPGPKSGSDHHMFGKKRPEHSAKLLGRPNEKMKGLLIGDKNPMKNPDNAKKVSIAKSGIPRAKLTCPHCGKEGGDGNMQRWHFNNCSFITC